MKLSLTSNLPVWASAFPFSSDSPVNDQDPGASFAVCTVEIGIARGIKHSHAGLRLGLPGDQLALSASASYAIKNPSYSCRVHYCPRTIPW